MVTGGAAQRRAFASTDSSIVARLQRHGIDGTNRDGAAHIVQPGICAAAGEGVDVEYGAEGTGWSSRPQRKVDYLKFTATPSVQLQVAAADGRRCIAGRRHQGRRGNWAQRDAGVDVGAEPPSPSVSTKRTVRVPSVGLAVSVSW